MHGAVAPRDGTRLFLLDGEGVLFSEQANELCSLSPLGVLVWQGLESARSPAAIAEAVAETFGVAGTEASSLVQSTLGLLREHGLVAGSVLPVRPAAPEPPAVDTRIPPHAEPKVVAERRYTLLGSRLRVRFTDPTQERWVHPVFAHLEAADGQPTDVVIDLIAGDGHHFLYRDGEPMRLVTAVDRLAPVVKELLWFVAIDRHPHFLYLHAGVVGDDRRCLLLPAPSGGGKSSLTAALCHVGFRYFSDEVALVEPDTFHVRAIPLSLCVKDSGWDLLTRYYEEIPALATHHRNDGKVVRYLPPRRSQLGDVEHSYPVSHIVFPRYDPVATTDLRPLGKVPALRRLMDECMAIRTAFDVSNVTGLVEWMRGVATYELPMSSVDRAAELVATLARR